MLNLGSTEPLEGLFTSHSGKAERIKHLVCELNALSSHLINQCVDGSGSSETAKAQYVRILLNKEVFIVSRPIFDYVYQFSSTGQSLG